MDDGIKNPVN